MQLDYSFARNRVREGKAKLFLIGLSLILGLTPVSTRAQGVSVQGQAVVNSTTSVSGIPGNSVLQAVPNATISVCSSAGGGIPCSPLVTIYSNVALTVVAANPLTADVNGNFSFFVAPNATGYIYSQTGPGIVGQLFTISPQSTLAAISVLGGGIFPATSAGLTAACAAAGSSGTITIAQPIILTANVICGSGVTVQILPPGSITTTGFTLTINGPLIANNQTQIFFGTGTVSISRPTSPIFAAWFPSAGANNDICGQIDSAYASMLGSNTLTFPPAPTNAGWSCVTGIVLATPDKYPQLTCGPSAAIGGPVGGGCTINFTPTAVATTTAESFSGTVATFTMTSNPQTFGFMPGEAIVVAACTDATVNGNYNISTVTSTQITFASSHGAGSTTTCTVAPTAITLDYAGIGGVQVGHGLSNFYLSNNNCATSGGCGSAANGLICGKLSSSGCGFANINSVDIVGFANGEQMFMGTSYGVLHQNDHYLRNTVGYTEPVSLEMMTWVGGDFTQNGTGASIPTAVGYNLSWNNVHFDDNTVWGVQFAANPTFPSSADFKDCHFENLAGGTFHYISAGTGVAFNMVGGDLANDTSGGTGDFMIQTAGVAMTAYGTQIHSNETMTGMVQANTPVHAMVQFVNQTQNTIQNIFSGTSANVTNLSVNGFNGGGTELWSLYSNLTFPQSAGNVPYLGFRKDGNNYTQCNTDANGGMQCAAVSGGGALTNVFGISPGFKAPVVSQGLYWTGGSVVPAAATGFYPCYGDTPSLMVKCSYNNGSFFPLPLTGNTAGTHSDSGFYQTATAAGCTTAASIGGICASVITETWPVAFADTNYKVTCTPVGAATNLPSAPYAVTLSLGNVTVNYFAITAAAASWPNVTCTAVHN